jgi:DNA-binding transcriptional MerR regulator
VHRHCQLKQRVVNVSSIVRRHSDPKGQNLRICLAFALGLELRLAFPRLSSIGLAHFHGYGFSILQQGPRRHMGHNQPIRNSAHTTTLSEIPDKLYFRIGEVARLCEVPAYVLRFWESEFPQLKPNKGGTGQRLYRRRDVEMALRVKSLLKEEGYTIPGARQLLRAEFRLKEPQLSLLESGTSNSGVKQLRSLRRELQAIAAMLAKPVGKSATAPRAPSRPAAHAAKVPAVHTMRNPTRASSPARPKSSEIPFD